MMLLNAARYDGKGRTPSAPAGRLDLGVSLKPVFFVAAGFAIIKGPLEMWH